MYTHTILQPPTRLSLQIKPSILSYQTSLNLIKRSSIAVGLNY